MIFYAFCKINGSLAQLVEQLTLNQWAKSSSLLRSTIGTLSDASWHHFFYVKRWVSPPVYTNLDSSSLAV